MRFHFLMILGVLIGCKEATTTMVSPTPVVSTYSGSGSVTQGAGSITLSSIYSCTGGRVTNLGKIESTDKKTGYYQGKIVF